MFRSLSSVWAAVLIVAASGCDAGPHSAAGFRLASGDTERGKHTFVAQQCYNCHTVDGVDMPPVSLVPQAVVLGGATHQQMTDGYLVTAIINPSHVLSGRARGNATVAGGGLPMPDFSDAITVRELTDLVAFLQSRYSVKPVSGPPVSL